MAKVGTISPIKKQYSPEYQMTIAGSLASQGRTQYPGTAELMTVCKEADGKYRTGLDEEATYIKYMQPEEAAQEIERIKTWKKIILEQLGWEESFIAPRGAYYKDMMKYFGQAYGETKAVQPYKMIDGPNTFSFSDAYQLITYCWLRVHPLVAPSFNAFMMGDKRASGAKYFVDNEEDQAATILKSKSEINKAVAYMDALNPEDRLKFAKLLGLPVRYGTTDAMVYNSLDGFLKEAETGKGLANVNKFNRIKSYQQENLNIRYIVKLALDFNIYRKKQERIFEGEVEKALNEEDLIVFLSSPKNQDELSLLQDKVRDNTAKEMI